MARTTQTFEGGTNGAAVTTANSGGGSGDALTGVFANGTGASIVYDNTRASHGNLSAKVTPVASSTAYVQRGSASASLATKQLAARGYLYLTALTTDATGVMFFYNGSDARTVSAHLDASGKLYARGAGTTILATATNAFPLNQWVRVELYAVVGTSSTTGEIHLAYYLGDSTTPVQVFDLTGVDCGTVDLASVGFGKLSNSAYATPFWMDTFAVETAATGFIGRVVVAAAATVRPSGVSANPGAWVNDAGATPSGAALADESDTTYNTNPGNADGESITYTLPPLSAGTVQMLVRMLKPGNASAPPVRVELLEGSTVRATRNVISTTSTATFDSGTGIADYVLDLTSTENAAISDRTALSLRLTATPA